MSWAGQKANHPSGVNSIVIDASTFARSFNAFWHAHTPTCEHSFVA